MKSLSALLLLLCLAPLMASASETCVIDNDPNTLCLYVDMTACFDLDSGTSQDCSVVNPDFDPSLMQFYYEQTDANGNQILIPTNSNGITQIETTLPYSLSTGQFRIWSYYPGEPAWDNALYSIDPQQLTDQWIVVAQPLVGSGYQDRNFIAFCENTFEPPAYTLAQQCPQPPPPQITAQVLSDWCFIYEDQQSYPCSQIDPNFDPSLLQVTYGTNNPNELIVTQPVMPGIQVSIPNNQPVTIYGYQGDEADEVGSSSGFQLTGHYQNVPQDTQLTSAGKLDPSQMIVVEHRTTPSGVNTFIVIGCKTDATPIAPNELCPTVYASEIEAMTISGIPADWITIATLPVEDKAVVASLHYEHSDDPAVLRFRQDGREIRVQEDQSHDPETSLPPGDTDTLDLMLFPMGLDEHELKTGSITANHNWQTVTFPTPFASTPVVVAQILSYNGNQGAYAKIKNVTPYSFQIKVKEWKYLDATHLLETIHWVATLEGEIDLAGTPYSMVAKRETGVLAGPASNLFATIGLDRGFKNYQAVAHWQHQTQTVGPIHTRIAAKDSHAFNVQVMYEEAVHHGLPATHQSGGTLGYILIGKPEPTFQQTDIITCDTCGYGAQFGTSVASHDSTVVIGAPVDVPEFTSNVGAAYVYEYVDSQWVPRDLISSGGELLTFFGQAVGLGGEYLSIAEPLAGEVRVYQRNPGGGWDLLDRLFAPNPYSLGTIGMTDEVLAVTDQVTRIYDPYQGQWSEVQVLSQSGTSLSLSDDGQTLAVLDGEGGSVRVYQQIGGPPRWTEIAYFNTPPTNGSFGSIDIQGSRIVVGNTHDNQAYIYQQQGSQWPQVATLQPQAGDQGMSFGAAVVFTDAAADTVLVGNPTGDPVTNGNVVVFQENQGNWSYLTTLLSDATQVNNRFGSSLHVDGDTLFVGAVGNAAYGNLNRRGRVYVFAIDQ